MAFFAVISIQKGNIDLIQTTLLTEVKTCEHFLTGSSFSKYS